MCYRGGRGVVPTDESTSIRNCGDVYFPMHMCIGDAVFYYMRSLQALAAKASVDLDEDRRIIAGDDAGK